MSAFADQLKQRSKCFAPRIIKMTALLPRSEPGRVLGKQILRSGTSIGANYREAYRARSKAEFLAKIGDCLKETEETIYWMELIAEGGLLPSARLKDLQRECGELVGISSRFRRTVAATCNS